MKPDRPEIILYRRMITKNLLARFGRAIVHSLIIPDPKHAAGGGICTKNYMATGIDGVWNDMNEPAVFDGPDGTMPENNWHRGGGDLPADVHQRYHNVYGMLMVKASRDGILKAKSR